MTEDEFNLNSLIVDEEEVQTATVIILSMFIYDLFFTIPQNNLMEIIEDSRRILEEKYDEDILTEN